MNRKEFLKGMGLAGITSFLLPADVVRQHKKIHRSLGGGASCELIPQETTGPYPLDLSSNPAMFRQDIRESQAGVRLDVKLRIIGASNCLPMPNCRVDLWHCNALGYYSGYTTNGQNGSQNNVGQTWLRGIQMTDANGEVTFTTIFPGWYSGRLIHIHFQVFLSSVLQATSQLTFPVAAKNALLAAHTPYSNYGSDPTTLATDNIFSDGYSFQMATLTPNSTTGGYDSFLEVTVNGTGTSGLQNLEPETGGQFKLGQNFPNPYAGSTTVPFTLTNPSDVRIDLFDLSGKKMAEVIRDGMGTGEQTILLDMAALGLAGGNYVYQLQVENNNGVFRQCKMMTAVK